MLVKYEEEVGWQWTVGNRAAAPLAMPGSSEVLERKRIKTIRRVLGSVVYKVLYHRWAQHGLGRVERRHRKAFFVPNWVKLTGSRLYHPAQAHRCGGRHHGTRLTRPETMRCFPREADTVEEEAHKLEGVFRARAV